MRCTARLWTLRFECSLDKEIIKFHGNWRSLSLVLRLMTYNCVVGLAGAQAAQPHNLNNMKGPWFAFSLFLILRPHKTDCRQRKGGVQRWRGQNTELDERNTYSLFRSASGSSSYSKKSRGKGKAASYKDDDGIYKMKKTPKSKSKKEKRGMRGSSKCSKSSSTDWEHDHPPVHLDESSDYSEDPSSPDYTNDTPSSIDQPSSIKPPLPTSQPPSMETPVPPAFPQQLSPPSIPIVPTAPPVQSGETAPLEEFTLTYLFGQSDREPFDSEVSAAVSITRTYLNGFFKQRIDDLEQLDTRLSSVELTPNEPFQMNFTSLTYFQVSASSMPTEEELNLLRVLSFSGDNILIYIGLLQSLPPDNIFSSTIDVSDSPFKGGTADTSVSGGGSSTREGGDSSNVAVVASVGAGTFVALLVGLAVYRHSGSGYGELDKAEEYAGVATVAEETYMGNSTMFSASERRSRCIDDNQSDWGISTQANTEDVGSVTGRESICEMEPLENQLETSGEYNPCDPLSPQRKERPFAEDNQHNEPAGDIPPAGSESEDDDVPLRVVDLIKKFSPMR